MRIPFVLPILVAALVASCSHNGDTVAIRALPTALAAGDQPAAFRLAEAGGQLALGNVALALEGYRKAMREAPASITALVGVATCYDRMGRFDLSRRHYEAALALAPNDPALYEALAQSLAAQGRAADAAAMRAEAAQRLAGTPPATLSATSLPPPPAPVLAEPAGRSVTVALRPAQPMPSAVAVSQTPLRLQRLSLGEVALVSVAERLWTPRLVRAEPRRAEIAFAPLRREAAVPVMLLNAARVRGLAARTQSFLAARGFAGARIGDAAEPQASSVILYPLAERARARLLSRQFGFPVRHQSGASRLTVLLGRDAARDSALKAPA